MTWMRIDNYCKAVAAAAAADDDVTTLVTRCPQTHLLWPDSTNPWWRENFQIQY